MSKLLAVAARELRERWLLFPGALASGCFPLVLPAFGVERELMPVVGAVGAILLGLAAGLIAGASMLARDAANGRLGFLFSRPVSWPVIWGGKWLAAIVLVVLGGFLAAIPWMVAYPLETVGGHHGGSWLRAMTDDPQGAVIFFVVIVLAIGLANFGATLFRSRSPWVAVDLVLLVATFWATRRYVAPLWLYGVLIPWGPWSVALALAPLVLGLVAGSMAQVAVGRTDVRRAHGALSVGFWAVVGLTLASAAGYWAWVRSAGPADVDVHAVSRGPGGRWIYVEGSAGGSGYYPHGFLIDTASGRYAASPDPRWDLARLPLGQLFSADGRSVAQPHLDDEGRGAALRLLDLAADTPRVTEVVLESSPPPTWKTAFALSPSATTVFVVHESGASLFALPSGRRVATTTIEPGWRPAVLRFRAEGEARAWLVPHLRERAEMRVVDLSEDGRTRALTFPLATTLHGVEGWRSVTADGAGRRILTLDGGLHLRDGATGELIAMLAEGGRRSPIPEAVSSRGVFLADGRVVVGGGQSGIEANKPRASLQVFDRDGVRLGETRLDLGPGRLSVGPEVAPGRVAASSFRSPYLAEDTLIVDLGEGRVVERISGLRPAVGFFWNVSPVPADAGPTSVHFFRDVEGRVIRIDFASGERKVVAGPDAPRGERIRFRR
jgi:hypothetical protein